MATPTPTDYADLFFEHLRALRRYAERVFVDGEILSESELAQKAHHLTQFMDAGRRCEFTDEQLVRLLYSELLV